MCIYGGVAGEQYLQGLVLSWFQASTEVLGTILTHGDHHSKVELYTHMTFGCNIFKNISEIIVP